MPTSRLENQIKKLQRQIQNDRTLEVLDDLLNFMSLGSSNVYDEVLLQKSRYVRLERQERMGLVTRQEASVEKNRINLAILHLLDEWLSTLSSKEAPAVPPAPATELSPSATSRPEIILGINNLKQISWVSVGLEAAKGVCRILAPCGLGTGFLISHDLIMTNNHVIRSADEAQETVIEFNYQQTPKGGYETSYRYKLDVSRFHTNANLDYTLVGILPGSNSLPVDHWGWLKLNPNATPVRGELACIIQHPNGGLKQISMTTNWVMDVQGHYLWYTTDTMPGSSGSPVFNDAWQVVAIHHAGGIALPAEANNQIRRLANEGILMSHIKPDAQSAGLWPASL